MIKLTPVYNGKATELWVKPGDIQRIVLRPDHARNDSHTEVMLVCPGAEAELWQVVETPDEIQAMIGSFYMDGLKAAINAPDAIKRLIELQRRQDLTFEESAAVCFMCGELDKEHGKSTDGGHFLCGSCWNHVETRVGVTLQPEKPKIEVYFPPEDEKPKAETWLNPRIKVAYSPNLREDRNKWSVVRWSDAGMNWQFLRGYFVTSDIAIFAAKEESRRINVNV